MTMLNKPPADQALAGVAQVEALADQLSAAADEIHARIMKAIHAMGDRPATDPEQVLARGMLEDETLLRQRADGLYADAATSVVRSLALSQQQLMQLTADAAQKIARIEHLKDVAGMIGAFLTLAGAAATGRPATVVAAVEHLGKQVKKIQG